MTSQKADSLLFHVGEVCASAKFYVKLAQHFFIEKLAINRTYRVCQFPVVSFIFEEKGTKKTSRIEDDNKEQEEPEVE